MKKRTTLFSAMLAALVPVPVFAFDSGVIGMQAAEEIENQHQSVAAWAFKELQSLEVGFRQLLEPVLPRVQPEFSLLDAEIRQFIAEGAAEQIRITELITELESRTDVQPDPVENSRAPDVKSTEVFSSVGKPLFEQEMSTVPEIEVFTENGFLLNIDTSKGLDLPDMMIDPRDGGQYESEIPVVQTAFDLVQLLQDQVPAPIQSVANDLYDKLTGTEDKT